MKPRIGFLGAGWIGRHRMQAMIDTGAIDATAFCDPAEDCAAEAAALAPAATRAGSVEALLDLGLDGIVIATPSAMHAEQAIAALNRGVAVFCQKPLGRNAIEARAVVDAARAADRLLAVDFSYRLTAGMQAVRPLIAAGDIGNVYAVDLVFHNAYGPDKAWFYDRAQSGGGCLADLGVHLIDLALWVLDFPAIRSIDAVMFNGGRPAKPDMVEDYTVATLHTCSDVVIRLACSWRLPAGRDAIIEADFYGTDGGAALRNVDGSFYDFVAERYHGTARQVIAAGPDPWGARAAAQWARTMAYNPRFDPAAEQLVRVAATIDAIYQAAADR